MCVCLTRVFSYFFRQYHFDLGIEAMFSDHNSEIAVYFRNIDMTWNKHTMTMLSAVDIFVQVLSALFQIEHRIFKMI